LSLPVCREQKAGKQDGLHVVLAGNIDFDGIVVFTKAQEDGNRRMNVTLLKQTLDKGFAYFLL
jgi:hypothetical protein